MRAEVVAGEAAYLISERAVTALMGPLVEALVPLLDGTRDLPAVLQAMPAGTTLEELTELVGRLMAAGLVRPAAQPRADADENALAYWDAAGLDPVATSEILAGARLDLLTLGSVDSAAPVAALSAAGLTLTSGDQDRADLTVVLCSDYLDPDLVQVDAAHRAAGRPWLLAKPTGATVWIGPVFQPVGHACWNCMSARLSAHRQVEAYVQATLGRSGPAPRHPVSIAPLNAAAMQLVALEATKWLAGYRYSGQDSVYTFDSLTMSGQHHPLRARPQCPACGDPAAVRAISREPIVLQPRRKACYSSGGHRAHSPEQVLAAYRHLVSPITGVIKEIGRDRRGPAFFNAFRSGPNLATGVRTLRGLKSALRIENGGKGTTPLHAEVSALCEALERHCGNFAGDEDRVSGSLRSLGEPAIDPNRCQLFHERQFESRAEWNASHPPFQYVCAPFDRNAVLDWTPVWSLTQERHRLLPTGMLYFGAPVPPGPRYVRADSNGNAAGSSLEDAVLQGLLELVERDAVSMWWYNRTTAPRVDLDAFADPWIGELRDVYAGLRRDVWVLDVTSDLGIPTMVALSAWAGRGNGIMFGFGAHLDPQVALRRALTEMNQLMPAIVQLGPDAHFECDDDPDAVRWFRNATVGNQPYLAADPMVRPRRPADYGYVPGSDIADDVHAIRAKLEGIGMEMLVLNQTRPDIGLPVVKVIVPGLRHFWARFAPGRLYDVPVQLGRLAEPTPYEGLNPTPIFI